MSPLAEVPLIVAPILLLVGGILLLKPPKKINNLYGYRTARSMQSQEAWDYAQPKSGKQLIYLGMAYLSTSLLSVVFENIPEVLAVLITLGLLIAGFLSIFIRMERDLKDKFDG